MQDKLTVTPAINKDIPLEQSLAGAETDTTTAAENELEKLLKDKELNKNKEDKAIADAAKKPRWNVKPQVAPVFYSSLSQGSPIDSQFAGNSKQYDNDLSYGVGVDYALNDRFSIRSGINTVNLSYATQGIEFYASLNQQTNNIAASARPANIVVQNKVVNDPALPVAFVADQLPTQKFDGSLVQQMGYIEVPVELSYALVDKKFGIDVIGGVSTLFLNDNNVTVVSSQGYTTEWERHKILIMSILVLTLV